MSFHACRRSNRRAGRIGGPFLLLAALVVGGCGDSLRDSAGQRDSRWVEVAPAGAGFRVEFPGTPNDEALGSEGQAAVIGGRRFVLEAGGAETAYRVEYLDYDQNLIALLRQASGGGTQPIIVAAGKKLAADLDGTTASESPIMLHDHPGTDITIELQAGGRARARVYLVGNRLYRLVVSKPGAELPVADAERFLDSFTPQG
jgi:hypothetical protein